MAIYVYVTATGQLFSYCPNDTDPVAPASVLAANGLTAVSGLPPTDATHTWNPATKTVIAVAARLSVPGLLAFWQRFTQAERESLENLAQTGTQTQKNKLAAFKTYAQAAGSVDCNDPYVQTSVQLLETVGIIAAGRAAQILV